TRAAIRLPFNSQTRMVFAVADRQGEIVGLFRMPDATVFSIDVAVAKARNVAYYNDAAKLQPQDRVDQVAPGTAFTNRSFRYLALPRFPEGIDGRPPGPFSILNDGGVDPATGLQLGPPLPASAFQSVQGFDAFNPGTNFRSTGNPLNENGIVFFPGSSGVYRARTTLIGGFGVSGDGVDQDDVVTSQGILGFEPPELSRIDQVFVRGVRVPYMKFNRNPEGGVA
ncbi:MAG: heme-binding protein, partial [Gemmataceae bacterium]|nr:heme-binding protein [Gemmataceae bacterium]